MTAALASAPGRGLHSRRGAARPASAGEASTFTPVRDDPGRLPRHVPAGAPGRSACPACRVPSRRPWAGKRSEAVLLFVFRPTEDDPCWPAKGTLFNGTSRGATGTRRDVTQDKRDRARRLGGPRRDPAPVVSRVPGDWGRLAFR